MAFSLLARHIGAATLAGILAGVLVAGVLGRIAMRVAGFLSRPELIGVETSNGNRVGEITVEGTLALALFVGLTAGIGGGAFYASAEPWLRRLRSWRGVAFGAALFGAFGFTVVNPSNFDFQRFGVTGLNVAMFAALFVAFGALIAWIFGRIQGTIARGGTAGKGVEIATWLAALVGVVLTAGFFTSFGGLEDPLLPVLAGVVLIIPAIVRWRLLPSIIAYLAFAVPFVVGAVRTLSGLFEIAF